MDDHKDERIKAAKAQEKVDIENGTTKRTADAIKDLEVARAREQEDDFLDQLDDPNSPLNKLLAEYDGLVLTDREIKKAADDIKDEAIAKARAQYKENRANGMSYREADGIKDLAIARAKDQYDKDVLKGRPSVRI